MELTIEEFMTAAIPIAGNMFLNMVLAEARAAKLAQQLATLQQAQTNGERAAFVDANA